MFFLLIPIIIRGCIIKKLFIIISALLITTALFAQSNTVVTFHNFSWGTSMEVFIAGMGNPVHVDKFDGLDSLVYENIYFSGYRAFMVVYFSQNGLEGGTYYFDTIDFEELLNCYTNVQKELVEIYGETLLYETLLREMRAYETSWNLPGGYVYLKVNTRLNEPVTLWYSSPALTRMLRGS